jgi:6-pyruvoyl-tetrahydropterin synthase
METARVNGHTQPLNGGHSTQAQTAPAQTASRRAIFTLGMEVFFNSRHFVTIDGRPGRVHPHSYRVTVKIRQSLQPGQAFGLAFHEVRDLVQSETNRFNDKILNDLAPFNTRADLQPTTENLAAVIYQQVQPRLPAELRLDSVTVWESPTNYVTYEEAE